MDDLKKPPASKVYEIAARGDSPEEIVKLLAEAFPEAEPLYVADLFRQKAAAHAKLEERYRLEAEASRAGADFLVGNDYENLFEACEYLGLTAQELWDQIMDEAGIPKHEIPVTIQTGWEH